jgi:hypothetical protein
MKIKKIYFFIDQTIVFFEISMFPMTGIVSIMLS